MELKINQRDIDLMLKNLIEEKLADEGDFEWQALIENKVGVYLEQYIQHRLSGIIDKGLNKIFKDYLNRKIRVTDSYGDTVKEGLTIKDLIKEKLENFFNQMVDSDGRSGNYNTNKKRIDWILDNKIQESGNNLVKEIVDSLESTVKDYLKSEMKDQFTDAVFENVNIKKILNK